MIRKSKELWQKQIMSICEDINVPQMRPIHQIASEIYKDWRNVNYAARPYLDAMMSLDTMKDNYGMDSAPMIVSYFLSNASTWKGETAKRIKNELKAMLKMKSEQVGPAGEFGHIEDLWKFTKPENHKVKEGEMAPWRQQYGHGRLKTDFADTVVNTEQEGGYKFGEMDFSPFMKEYTPSGQGQIGVSHFMEQDDDAPMDSNADKSIPSIYGGWGYHPTSEDGEKNKDKNPWAIESALRGKGYYQECTLDEKSPPNFPKKLYNKIKKQYPGNDEAAYATMWKIHNKMEERVLEMQNKLEETSGTGGMSLGAGPPQVANWGKGTTKAGDDKMRKTAEKAGYKLAGGKIDKADPL